ncbi:2-succinyl-6-hydroxy-2,4-cyclohexadiene-1-carboxylic acid synthase/2-oxoglutarate decarboxylase [Chloroherpeton thalassium ATCC 35110]|uniref:2-succinyl-5-enolpyruvyl-6-hydroxy-3-cyclohexene-1-carboxylate synthase n=1 Tax=Chloroherpeton thalassium (strain ATCC 35110 / GB-78) TaxID=517418 RepID=B3QUU2_CHLT3|nr:2-succinyl-5-enolpyruvyl-6-hydroxy-3-cyclohexene-1-carboxylic-acid synthase [Chloroherpeton thalassium]ACF14443.1 2-succinyl-6-hydroxy-2,4-cyclohexadiene-1-carboxylic acid synthase/2-oxoglutarate decarboxylase [Chloroherpeton thalassium ATCC 35110]
MPNINSLWAALIVEELVRNHISYFCVSPGSRSTPLTVAVARNSKAESLICIDERAAAYHALGYARATGTPAVLVCTSGTAVANYFPAVTEAAMSCIPMLVLSADRPPELRDTGANQTIFQPGIFGDYVRWHFDMPCPDENIPPSAVLTTVSQAVYRAKHSPAGPVHLNCMFREPLAPIDAPVKPDYENGIAHWKNNAKPYSEYAPAVLFSDNKKIADIAQILENATAPLISVGRLSSQKEIDAVKSLTQTLNIPILADVCSGLRLGCDFENFISYFDQLLLNADFAEKLRPDAIIHFGGETISKRLQQAIAKWKPKEYIVVKNHPFRFDQNHLATASVHAEIDWVCRELESHLPNVKCDSILALKKQNRMVEKTLGKHLRPNDLLSEISVARLISTHIPETAGLFLSNSMPIRDMDMYATPSGASVRVGANRGASGIDGILASASGFAAGLEKPVTLLIGDLSLLHDLNSLFLIRTVRKPVILIVINNGGGGIFSFLPIAKHEDVFERYFETPQNLNVRLTAEMAGIEYFHPKTNAEFSDCYTDIMQKPRTVILEVKTERKANVELHKSLQKIILNELDALK